VPTYEWSCPDGHTFEIYCSISSKPEAPPCPEVLYYESVESDDPNVAPVKPVECGKPAHQVFLTPPTTWIPGVDHKTVLDYPGSKAHKAGHVHSHGFKYATKVSAGAGGMINPRTSAEAPIVNRVIPDYKTSTKRRLRKEGLL
jgi:hypothetical protein